MYDMLERKQSKWKCMFGVDSARRSCKRRKYVSSAECRRKSTPPFSGELQGAWVLLLTIKPLIEPRRRAVPLLHTVKAAQVETVICIGTDISPTGDGIYLADTKWLCASGRTLGSKETRSWRKRSLRGTLCSRNIAKIGNHFPVRQHSKAAKEL